MSDYTIETEEDFQRVFGGHTLDLRVQSRAIIPGILGRHALAERERAAMQARLHAQTTQAPEDYERAADLFDALGYTAGKVLREIARQRRAGKRPVLRVAPDGTYWIQQP